MNYTYPQLAEVREYGAAGGSLGAQSALTDAPDSAAVANYLRVVDTTTGAAVSVSP
jgi:hypothetical protein